MPRFIDSNVLFHAVVVQEPWQHAASRAFIERLLSEREEAFITETVLAELAATLASRRAGALSREEIARFLGPLLSSPSVHLADKSIWRRALEIFWRYSVDLADAHQAALCERDGGEVISFDSDFDRIPGVRRIEP
jgi:predicted nucleic acid-binding protein